MRLLKIFFCVLLLSATEAVDAEIIKNLDFYDSYELLNDEGFVLEEQLAAEENESQND
ncbi:MAG: hypothetical protein LW878_12655 [Proteobacteria bacterium]|nr:hypothetical protein [Pseudomonadota bacterium]